MTGAFWISILFPGAPHLRLPYVRHARVRGLRSEALGCEVETRVDGEPTVMTPIDAVKLGRVELLAPAGSSA